MASQTIYTLSELDGSQAPIAGGKGASLGELMKAGAPVPPGFVVASSTFTEVVRIGEHWQAVESVIRRLEADELEASQAAAEIATHLEAIHMPDKLVSQINDAMAKLGVRRVSVRSSATCEDSGTTAWAGQLETYLDVAPEEVVDRVRDCWRSMFSAPALAYGAAHGYGTGQFAVAVVVQSMIKSDISGIGFSVHPVTQEPNLMLIEACFGLGEAIVSGRIDPDQYVVERGSDKILESIIGNQREALLIEDGQSEAKWRELDGRGKEQKLTDEQTIDYANVLARIHDHYGHPVDTEWAIEDGELHVLQARPITTLAEEYQETLIESPDQWQSMVRRPQTLIEVSISSHWLDTRHAEKSLGIHIDRAMALQDEDGMSHICFDKSALTACIERVSDMIHNDRENVLEILNRGKAMWAEVEARIERGADTFRDLDEAADFFADVAQHTTAFPFLVLNTYQAEDVDDPEIRQLAQQLRSRTLYPAIEREIIEPIVIDTAKKLGFSAPEEAPKVTTWSELHREVLDRETLESRLAEVRQGRRFFFRAIEGNDDVRFLSQTGYLLMRLAHLRHVDHSSEHGELEGQAAWPGVYTGRARVVLAPDTVGQTFEEGEVLVSIQSSPELMPFLNRCGAIVTDDGGIACHAAIIARELRKPTLIGTNKATTMIHTGDLVEVDTYHQTVRIVERAEG